MGKLTAERARQLLSYDPVLGVLRWAQRTSNRIKVGDLAGYTEPDGRRQIRIDGTLYRVHRVIWLILHGDWPTHQVDHQDCDKTNHSADNLRAATNQQNMWNQRLKRSNKTGYKGVIRNGPNCGRRNPWRAEIRTAQGKVHLGVFPTPQAAHEAYKAAAIRYHGKFARW